MALLNRTWHRLISKHYSWTELPTPGPLCLFSGFIDFFDNFPMLSVIDVPDFPAELLSEQRIVKLETAKSVGIKNMARLDQFFLIKERSSLLKILRELSLWITLYNSSS